jgi:ribosome modulation factor
MKTNINKAARRAARVEGRWAYLFGLAEADCPYKADVLRAAWIAGWTSMDEEMSR